MPKHHNVSIMFPICSSCLSISHLKLFCSWQFIRFSSPGQGWAIIKPHQAWRGNHSWAFLSHGVFSQWQAHWLCWFWVFFCFPTSTVELLWYTDREGWRQRASQTHQAHSSVTVTKQHIILYYQHAPCWEIYLRTVILSAKQRSTRTHRWLILSRHSLVYHCLVTEMCYRNSLLHHRSGQSCQELRRCRMANNLACGSVGSRKLLIPWPVIFLLAFSIPTTFGVPW